MFPFLLQIFVLNFSSDLNVKINSFLVTVPNIENRNKNTLSLKLEKKNTQLEIVLFSPDLYCVHANFMSIHEFAKAVDLTGHSAFLFFYFQLVFNCIPLLHELDFFPARKCTRC